MEDLFLAIGAGLGFASVAGVRAFLLLVVALLTVIFATVGSPPISFMQLGNWLSLPLIVVLLVLLVLECALDKFASVGRLLNWVMVSVRMFSGAFVFAITIVYRDPTVLLGPMTTFYPLRLPGGLPTLAPWLIAGAVIAGAVAVAKAMARAPARTTRSIGVSPPLLSFIEDCVAVVGSLLLYVPLIPFLLVASVLLLYRRVNSPYGTGSISERRAL